MRLSVYEKKLVFSSDSTRKSDGDICRCWVEHFWTIFFLFARFLPMNFSDAEGSTNLIFNSEFKNFADRMHNFILIPNKKKNVSDFSFGKNKNENWQDETLTTKVNLVH